MKSSFVAAAAILLLGLGPASAVSHAAAERPVPPSVLAIMGAPKYAGATWGLRVVDLESGALVYNLGPDSLFFTGSVRKLFSVAEALDSLGPGHRFTTPVYRRGTLKRGGVLSGDLVLVASGDLTLGGRTTSSGAVAFTDFDHTESNSLGSSILTQPDPLAGVRALARQVAASGVRRVEGDVVVDDRLFRRFRVPNGNVLVTPITVNDNLIDVTIRPTRPGRPASVDWRPQLDDPSGALWWLSARGHLVEDEPNTALQNMALIVDSSNGIGAALDFGRFMFMNTDTAVHIHRLPVGNDFALRARGSIGPDGIGVTTSEIFDRSGFVGVCAQTLLVQHR